VAPALKSRRGTPIESARATFAIYIVKPEAFHFRRQIRAQIAAAGHVVWYRRVPLSNRAIRQMYPNVSGTLLALSVAHLSAGLCEVGMVRGIDLMRRLKEIRGTSTCSRECRAPSVRQRHRHLGSVTVRGITYHRNALHVSLDCWEANTDLGNIRILKRLPK